MQGMPAFYLIHALQTLVAHVRREPDLASRDWASASLEMHFDQRASGYFGRLTLADGSTTTWAPHSRLLLHVAQRVRRHLPKGTESMQLRLSSTRPEDCVLVTGETSIPVPAVMEPVLTSA